MSEKVIQIYVWWQNTKKKTGTYKSGPANHKTATEFSSAANNRICQLLEVQNFLHTAFGRT